MINNKLTNNAPTPTLFSSLLLPGLLLITVSSMTMAEPSRSNSSASAEKSAPLASYYSTLQVYETEGPYHQNSSEVLYSLGLELQKGGQHGKALKALRRAMHINRVNDGLNSFSQAPMLRSIINSQKSMARIEPVTNSYNQLLRIHIATYGRNAPRIGLLLNEVGLWHIDAYQFDESETRIDHLTSAYSLIISALKLSETNPDVAPSEQIQFLRSAALANFHLSRHQGDEWSSSTNSHYSRSADGFATTNPQRTKILSGASFRRGLACHQRIIELTAANPDASLEEKTRAQTELADWYLLFNHRTEAMIQYQQVLAEIESSDQADALYKQLFATPRLLPALRMEQKQGAMTGLFMTANVDISDKGWGSGIDNIEEALRPGQSPATNKNLRYKMLNAIKGARFRPQFVDNKPADVSDVTLTLPLIH